MLIKKKRQIPSLILKLETLLKRTSIMDPKRKLLEEELSKRYAGYRGEQVMDYYLEHLPNEEGRLIFQDLRLPISEKAYFQIDNLLIAPSYFLIFEGKNITGNLFFEREQLLRTLDEKVDSYPDPILQVENQQYFLKILLGKKGVPFLPSDSFVVVTNSKSIIKPNPHYSKATQKIIRPPGIRSEIEKMAIKHQKMILDKKELERLSKVLLKLHVEEDQDILNMYQMSEKELMKGLFCEECIGFSIVRNNRTWMCSICLKIDNQALIKGLMDYRLLFGTQITNSKFRRFFGIESSHMASKMLRSLNLPSDGSYKQRSYKLSLKDLQRKIEAAK